MQRTAPAKKYYLFVLFFLILLSAIFFLKLDGKLRNKFHIVIFKEKGFPVEGMPPGLTPEWIEENLRTRDYQISYFNTLQLSDKSFLNPDEVDLLILPYGKAFPVDAFSSIRNYFEEGGGLFNLAGKPFWKPIKKIDNEWQEVDSKPYEEFLSKLGIKFYQSEINPSVCEFNQELIKGFVGKHLFTDADTGLSITTSDKTVNITPTHGNVFPYQLPCRDFLPIIKSLDKSGEILAYPAIFVKSWRNPYRQANKVPNKWCLIAINGDKHPLNPQWPYARIFLKSILEYLSNKVVLHSLRTDYACYREAEQVKFEVKALNYGIENKILQLSFNLRDDKNRIVYKITKEINLLPLAEITINDIWEPKKFSCDFYMIEATIRDKDKFIDKEKAGFVVWDDRIFKKGEHLRIKGVNFSVGDRKIFLSGTNYYESKLGELMWLYPNILSVKEDFEKMQRMGLNFVRIHYHHSKWFRDHITKIAKLPLDSYYDISDNSALPTERSLRILDALIQLAQKYGLIFCMDIFSLVPEEMGNPIGWLGLKERILDPGKVNLQKEFVKILAQRYKDIPGITWDLWNEPRLEKKQDLEALRDWVSQLVGVFRENGDGHPITVGDDLSLELLDVLDYVSIHTYEPEKFTPPSALSKPFIFQEIWNDVGCSLEEEMKQAEKLKNDFSAALKKGAAGFLPWQWTRQARLWNDINEPERWDDELGVCTHDDGILKPAGRVYSLLINQIK